MILKVHPRGVSRLLLAVAAVLALAACGGPAEVAPQAEHGSPEESDPRAPRPDIVASLRADLAAARHPSDGGGEAEIVDGPREIVAGTAGRWEIIYRAGSHGIAVGGTLFLQVSPFWGWSSPQTAAPTSPGFTEVTTTAEGVELDARQVDQQLLAVRFGGRGLAAGEEVRMVYGAGPSGAVADRYAERASRFWIGVDGDGDGVRQWIRESPGVDVLPGPPGRLLATLPSTARPGEAVRLTLAVVDGAGSASPLGTAATFTGELRLSGDAAGAELPERVVLRAEDHGRRTLELVPTETGTVRLRVESADSSLGLVAETNPMQVASGGLHVLWADLQNHSAWSDGTAVPEDFFVYARDVAALDVVALTDHDHWGLPFLDQQPERWSEIRELTRRFHEPGRFVTLLGYEWTHWIHGHRHVLYFDVDADGLPKGEILSSIDPAYDTPQKLWDALRARGDRALTIAHHSAGGPIAVDWSIAPPPDLEPVTEIVSVHGSSEAPDSPSVIHAPVPGNFVRDALARGYRLGFLGSSDGHDGHPGLGHLASPSGGLAAILAEEPTRDAVYAALRARRVYATNGPRILLRVAFAGYRLGADVPLRHLAVDRQTEAGERIREEIAVAGGDGPVAGIPPNTLVVQIMAPGALERVDIVRSGAVLDRVSCEGETHCSFGVELYGLEVGEYLYVRAVQEDGGAAWSSPFYLVEGAGEPGS